MTDIEKILLTSSLTILGGIIVLTLGQIIIRFLFDPLEKLKLLIGEISDSLIFYANVYTNPGVANATLATEARHDLRRKASLLCSRANAVNWYCFFSLIHVLPELKNIKKASSELMSLSYAVDDGDYRENSEIRKKIIKLLSIKSFED